MSKYHVGKNGKPGICRAKNGNCPYGGADSHYDTKEAAYEAAQETLAKNHGDNMFSEAKSNKEISAEINEKYYSSSYEGDKDFGNTCISTLSDGGMTEDVDYTIERETNLNGDPYVTINSNDNPKHWVVLDNKDDHLVYDDESGMIAVYNSKENTVVGFSDSATDEEVNNFISGAKEDFNGANITIHGHEDKTEFKEKPDESSLQGKSIREMSNEEFTQNFGKNSTFSFEEGISHNGGNSIPRADTKIPDKEETPKPFQFTPQPLRVNKEERMRLAKKRSAANSNAERFALDEDEDVQRVAMYNTDYDKLEPYTRSQFPEISSDAKAFIEEHQQALGAVNQWKRENPNE